MAQPSLSHRSAIAQPSLNHRSTMAQPSLNHRSTIAQPRLNHGSTIANFPFLLFAMKAQTHPSTIVDTDAATDADSALPHAQRSVAYPAEILALIETIEGIQTRLQATRALQRIWSDEVFCFGCSTVKAARWGQLREGVHPYPAGVAARAKLLADLRGLAEFAHLHELAVTKAGLDDQARAGQRAYIEFPEHREIVNALTECAAKAGTLSQVRTLVFVGKSGFGKSAALQQLEADRQVQWSVSGLPSWKTAYAAFLNSLGISLGLTLPRVNWRAEALILAHLGTLSGVLAIEEIENLAPEALEFLKSLLNRTRVTLLLMLTPQSYLRICSKLELSDQLNRRTHLTLEAGAITPAKVRAFAPALWKGIRDDDRRLTLITTQANTLGGLCCVQTITAELLALHRQDHQPPTLQDVQDAVSFYGNSRRKQSLLMSPQALAAAETASSSNIAPFKIKTRRAA